MDVQATLLTQRIGPIKSYNWGEVKSMVIEVAQVLVKRKVAVKKSPLAVIRLFQREL
jgi:hypothetical protein